MSDLLELPSGVRLVVCSHSDVLEPIRHHMGDDMHDYIRRLIDDLESMEQEIKETLEN